MEGRARERKGGEEGGSQRISNSQLFSGAFDVTSVRAPERERDGLP